MHIQNLNLLKIFALATLLLSSIVISDEPLIVDVRSLEEVKTGIIQDAIHIEWTQIDKEINDIDVTKDQPIYLYCRSGNRSGKAAVMLEKIGFTNVINAGGIDEAAKKLEKKIVKYSE